MIGTTLSHYEITAELGRGGMGIVYKAEDTKLERTVAIKVLPASALTNEDDRARFYREAKAAAALNHPHIAAIHQIDEAVPEGAPSEELRPFIAMEFIEGGTLEDRIKQGPLKLDEAVRIATQVADALKAAHAKDIVHRDIKSANIMLTNEGQAKVLDFGLAQTAHSTKLTRMGSTLGTVAYMSPEQARGEEVDGRTDLYSLGTVLYEMIAGRLPFGGEYEQAVVYSILNADPEPLTALRTGVPMELERITGKLLAKEASRRYQTAADLIADLEGVTDQVRSGSGQTTILSGVHTGIHSGMRPTAVPAATTSGPKPWLLGVAAIVLLGVGWGMASLFQSASPVKSVEKLQVRIDGMRFISGVASSPNEQYFALTGYDWDGNEGLFFYDVRDGSLRHVERSEGGIYPWFSPSGDRVAFSIFKNKTMHVVDVPSGTPQTIQEDTWTSYWVDEDRLQYTMDKESDLKAGVWSRGAVYFHSIAQDSSFIVRGTEFKETGGEAAQWYFPGPRIPGTDLMLGNIQGAASFGLDPMLYLVDIDDRQLITTDYPGINPQALSKDILVYQVGDDAGPLVARRFDADSRSFTSQTVEIHKDAFFGRFHANPATGSILMAETNLPNKQIVSVLNEESGELIHHELPSELGQVFRLTLDEDRDTFVYSLTNGETGLSQLITLDLATGSRRVVMSDVRLFVEAVTEDDVLYALEYALDGGRIADEKVLTRRSLVGSSTVDTLSMPMKNLAFGGFSRSGIIVTDGDTFGRLDPDTRAYIPIADTDGGSHEVSPDGRYVVFRLPTGVHAIYDLASDELTSLPDINGGFMTWSADGSALYYVSLEDVPPETSEEGDVMRLPVRLSSGFERIGDPEFVAHTMFPLDLFAREDGVIMFAQGEMSPKRPDRTSTYVTWWRNIGGELDRTMPR